MRGIVSRSLVALELIAAWLLAGLSGFAAIMGPLGSHEEFGSLSQWGRIFALLSLFPLSFLALGYVRGAASEFVAALDAVWIFTGACIVVALCIAVLSRFGDTQVARAVDIAACSVVIPFVHLLIAGRPTPPNNPLERTREG